MAIHIQEVTLVSELVFLKLGGSLITDKLRFETPRPAVIERLAREIQCAIEARPEMQIVLGHGSGSFGHFAADRYRVHEGHLEDWRGYAETAAAAQRLNRLVTDALLSEGVRAVSLQPSASAKCHNGELVEMALDPIADLLEHGAVPLIYGDVALDDVKGCTIISTEQILVHLARAFRPERLIVAGEVAGVYSGDPQRDTIVRLIPEISSRNYEEIERVLSTSFGVDVTGGMLSKVQSLYELAHEQPNLKIRIITGRRNHLLERVLVDAELNEGTLIRY
jgi:isopentenyl phosphate kinase